MQCVMWIVQNSLEQLVVSILQQLVEIWQVGRTEPTALAAAQKSFYALSVLGGRGRIKVTSTVALHLTLNISETVRERDRGLVPKDTNRK